MRMNYGQYEEPEGVEVEVTAVAILEKSTVLMGSGTHTWQECEIEPDGSRSCTQITECDDDPRDLWDNQELHLKDIFKQCEDILKQLQRVLKVRFYAKHNISQLREAIAGWEETEWNVYEGTTKNHVSPPLIDFV